MPDAILVLGLVLAAALGVLIGWLFATLRSQRRVTELATTLELERRSALERIGELEKTFAVLSAQALKSNNQAFLQLAHETLKQFHVQARADLEQKEKAVEGMVQPIREALEKTAQQIREMEKARHEAYGSLTQHLETMTHTQKQLQDETSKLVAALRRPEVRGRWGELTLKRLAELAGMVEHCDFFEQEHTATADGVARPDMIVRMPGGREVVVDAKTPLDAYLNAIEAHDEAARTLQLQHHTRKVRERVKELAAKAYWNQFRQAPDFVVMFIPGEQFLSAALDIDRNLLEDALAQKVILATPTSLVALLRAVAYGWRQEALAANAEIIRTVGEELYTRLATFAEHLARVGQHLDKSVAAYNSAVSSFDARVLPGARRFAELGISGRKDLEEPRQVEKVSLKIAADTKAD